MIGDNAQGLGIGPGGAARGALRSGRVIGGDRRCLEVTDVADDGVCDDVVELVRPHV